MITSRSKVGGLFKALKCNSCPILVAGFCIGGGLSQTTAFGQDAGGDPQRKTGVRFVCSHLPAGAPEALELLVNAKTRHIVKVPLLCRSAGEYHPLPSGEEVRLGVMPKDPRQPFVTHVVAPKPESAGRLLGILIPKAGGGSEELRYRLALVDEGAFRLGDFHFVNLTPYEFGLAFDGEQLAIGKHAQRTYRPKTLSEARNAAVIVSFRVADPPAAWQVMTRSTWRLRPTRKEVCLFLWDEDNQRPALKGLTLFDEADES